MLGTLLTWVPLAAYPARDPSVTLVSWFSKGTISTQSFGLKFGSVQVSKTINTRHILCGLQSRPVFPKLFLQTLMEKKCSMVNTYILFLSGRFSEHIKTMANRILRSCLKQHIYKTYLNIPEIFHRLRVEVLAHSSELILA